MEIGIYQNKYQRPLLYDADVFAQPIWDLDQLCHVGRQLKELRRHWKVLQKEAKQLVENHNLTVESERVVEWC